MGWFQENFVFFFNCIEIQRDIEKINGELQPLLEAHFDPRNSPFDNRILEEVMKKENEISELKRELLEISNDIVRNQEELYLITKFLKWFTLTLFFFATEWNKFSDIFKQKDNLCFFSTQVNKFLLLPSKHWIETDIGNVLSSYEIQLISLLCIMLLVFFLILYVSLSDRSFSKSIDRTWR